MDELICKLRANGFGLHIGNIFVGCIMYADDIMLLSSSCYGVQKLVDICAVYGQHWNICFNNVKTQCLTFGGKNPQQFKITLNNKIVEWNNKLKYLGCTSPLSVGLVAWITVIILASFMATLILYCQSYRQGQTRNYNCSSSKNIGPTVYRPCYMRVKYGI